MTAWKSQRENLFLMRQNLAMYSWITQVMMLMVQHVMDTNLEISSDDLQPLIKVFGLLNTRVKKNETKALLELIYCSANVTDQPISVLTFRDQKLAKDVLANYIQQIRGKTLLDGLFTN